MAYQMAATAVTLNDLEGHSPVAGFFSNAIRRTFMQHFTRFQLTVCLHGYSALAELRVKIPERDYVTFGSMLSQIHLSVVLTFVTLLRG